MKITTCWWSTNAPVNWCSPIRREIPLSRMRSKAFLGAREAKPGNVFLGVVHRIDRPVSGAVIFAKTGKALTRLNEMIKEREIDKYYWAITENPLQPEAREPSWGIWCATAGRTNPESIRSPCRGSKEARLNYKLLGEVKTISWLRLSC